MERWCEIYGNDAGHIIVELHRPDDDVSTYESTNGKPDMGPVLPAAGGIVRLRVVS